MNAWQKPVLKSIDPRHTDRTELIRWLSTEIASRYEKDAGPGSFAPEDVLVPKSIFLIAYLDGRRVGCGALRPCQGTIGEIKRRYVDAAVRGRGIGAQLLAAQEAKAQEFGYDRVILETGVKQPEAIRLCERAGSTRKPCHGICRERANSVCFERSMRGVAVL